MFSSNFKMPMLLLLAIVVFFVTTQLTAAEGANTLAVCGCGKVFVPDQNTLYIKSGDKEYACCSKGCHDMAMKDPAAAARMSEAAFRDKLTELNSLKLAVANVTAVTEKGTKALCGCGKEFIIDETTEYFNHEGKSYACCSHACHEMAAKDPAGSAKMFKEKFQAGKM